MSKMVYTHDVNRVHSAPASAKNSGLKCLGGRCNNICDNLERGRNYNGFAYCRVCSCFIRLEVLNEDKASRKICPCCGTCVRRKTRYSGKDPERGKIWRANNKKSYDPNEVFGTRSCRSCSKKFERKLHQGNKWYCDECKK